MTSTELSEWMAFARLEPFGAQVEDLRFANLMALIANVQAPQKGKVWQAIDFMADYDGSVEAAREEQVVEKMSAFSQALAARRNLDRGVREEKIESPP